MSDLTDIFLKLLKNPNVLPSCGSRRFQFTFQKKKTSTLAIKFMKQISKIKIKLPLSSANYLFKSHNYSSILLYS